MDALLDEQSATGKQIETICSNFTKDGPRRWTQTYLVQRMSSLHTEWSQFKNRHSQLETKKVDHPKEEYFTMEYFEKIAALYSKYSEKMLTALSVAQSTEDTPEPTGGSEMIRHQRASIKAMRRLAQQAASGEIEHQSKAFYVKQLEALDKYWAIIVQDHQEIMTQTPGSDYKEEEYFNAEDEYLKASIHLQDKLDQLKGSITEAVGEVKLPRITLPTFDGQYTKWTEFKDLFTELIHKRTMNGAQKLHYLKANLHGEPSKLLQHFATTDHNCQAAWDMLVDRYENKRLIVTSVLNTLCQQSPITNETAGAVKRLLDTTRECLSAISNLGIDTSNWDPLVLHLMVQRLDKESRRLYEQSLKSSKELQGLSDFYEFLTSRYQTLEAINTKSERPRQTSLMTSNSQGCIVCHTNGHSISTCRQFAQKKHDARCQLVKHLELCFNCLQRGHRSGNCTAQSCKRCNSRHHTMLHPEAGAKKSSNSALKANTSPKGDHEVILATAVVDVVNAHGTSMPCRTILDSGSQMHFISEKICQQLGLPRSKINVPIAGIGDIETTAKYSTTVRLQSRTTCFHTVIEAVVLPKISEAQPTAYLETEEWNIPPYTPLADPDFHRPQRIDLLLGAELYLKLILPGQTELGPSLPTLQNTRLGWIVAGKAITCRPSDHKTRTCNIATKHSTSTLEKQIEKFWMLENHIEENTPMSQEEVECETHFQDTVRRNKDGRFMVQLPFKRDPEAVGQSEAIAMKRFRGYRHLPTHGRPSLQIGLHASKPYPIENSGVI